VKHARADYAGIQDPTGKIPEDEPVFLIRAQDIAGPTTVLCWANLAEKYGASREIVEAAKLQAARMHEWQSAGKVKVPDLPQPPKYNIGDTVKCVKVDGDMTSPDLVGMVGTVREIDPLPNGDYNYDVDGHYMHEQELEAV
jgi:hypothetical protein